MGIPYIAVKGSRGGEHNSTPCCGSHRQLRTCVIAFACAEFSGAKAVEWCSFRVKEISHNKIVLLYVKFNLNPIHFLRETDTFYWSKLKIERFLVLAGRVERESALRASAMLLNFLHTPGAKLPLYTFSKSNALNFSTEKQPCSPFLDALFKEWEERKTRSLFHHDITSCPNKILQGEVGFITTLVEGRDQKKRPTEFKIDQVLQPFNKEKFNFTKVVQEEVIFLFEQNETSGTGYFECGPTTVGSYSPNVVLINVSPIGYGHVLLIPHLLECLPQRIDRDSFFLALCMAKEAGSHYFRVGYNSLGGFATINHLHFQAYYLEAEFPVEKVKTREIPTLESTVKISELMNYPVRGLVFEGEGSLDDLCDVVSSATIFLQEENTPFNVLISESGKRIFLLLQCYAKKLALGQVRQELVETQINPAVWELSGHLVLKRRKDYEETSETSICQFLAETTLPENQFQEVKKRILSLVVQKFCK